MPEENAPESPVPVRPKTVARRNFEIELERRSKANLVDNTRVRATQAIVDPANSMVQTSTQVEYVTVEPQILLTVQAAGFAFFVAFLVFVFSLNFKGAVATYAILFVGLFWAGACDPRWVMATKSRSMPREKAAVYTIIAAINVIPLAGAFLFVIVGIAVALSK